MFLLALEYFFFLCYFHIRFCCKEALSPAPSAGPQVRSNTHALGVAPFQMCEEVPQVDDDANRNDY